ncbi:MAG: xanthine phosphoribosyltransferase [Oscillospiraceae bacterium]|nr:xanthine phosphoribosyltransferase [Oscillospiraceae bacterium]
MQALIDRILADAEILPGNIIKVGGFLNHQYNTDLLREMGKEVARLYANEGVTKIVTIEASGIAFAAAVALEMNVPFVFAKKHSTANLGGEVYSATVHSYTHNKDYNIIIPKAYLSQNDCVLILDDFLAKGAAARGLIEIIKASGAKLAGVCTQIEKGFQGGGDELRDLGIRVDALALVESMSEGSITFRQD